ncbi:MAG: hypothetical protein DRO06_01255, partial [Thermoproteota archaeon]
ILERADALCAVLLGVQVVLAYLGWLMGSQYPAFEAAMLGLSAVISGIVLLVVKAAVLDWRLIRSSRRA